MRLLSVDTKELVQFLPNQIPPYAVLSHTWSSNPDDEFLFTDIGEEKAKRKRAYKRKVLPACKRALKRGLDYLWIDTCCIDKSSSAELQEAINSMFKWYLYSAICFVYLEDVSPQIDDSTSLEMELEIEDLIVQSRWFTRGWTLQELVAPSNLIFYSKDWTELGTRAAFATKISEKIKIDEDVLNPSLARSQRTSIPHRSVACRMSWASFRETTRPEDIAYCLLGIFDVNMPLLYGEGEEKAFRRLQEEILKSNDDQSLLAWTVDKKDGLFGPLADHPRQFQHASSIIQLPGVPDSYSMTSSGLRIELLVVPDHYLPFQHGFWGVLRCRYKDDYTGPIAIPLEPQLWHGKQVYARRRGSPITIDRSKLTNQDIFQNAPLGNRRQPEKQSIIIHRSPHNWNNDCEDLHFESWPTDCTLLKAIPEKNWDSKARIMATDDYDVTRAFIFEHTITKARFAVVFGFAFRYPEETLGLIKLYELDNDQVSFPKWLRNWQSATLINLELEWGEEDFEDTDDPTLSLSREGEYFLIEAALRKGHIMGSPFWVISFQVIRDEDTDS